MTLVIWIVAAWLSRGAAGFSPPNGGLKAAAPQTAPLDFQRDVRPILDAHCQPCHFTGGKMYEKLPFDRPETILRLGTKLFTRIKDEKQRVVIREFLAQK
jgi:hypothetical protein